MLSPLRVEFLLSGHMEVPAMPIHLDSLVAYARYQRALEMREHGSIRTIILDLPFNKKVHENAWVWQASALMFDVVSNAGLRHWTRKTVIPDHYARALTDGAIERGRKTTGIMADARVKNQAALCNKEGGTRFFSQKIDTLRGDMKSELQAYPVQVASKAVAFCVGDPDELEMLLDPEMGILTHIGKRARLGHGKVVGLSITADDTALTLWKKRILPWPEDGYLGLDANVVPPYWDASGRVAAWAHPGVF